MSDRRWQAALWVVFIFVLGFVAGGLSVNLYFSRAESEPPSSPSAHHATPEEATQKLAEELNLSSEQQEQIHQILVQTQQTYRDLRQEVRPRFRAIRSQSQSSIRTLLNPDQQVKFDELVRRRDEESRKRYGRKE